MMSIILASYALMLPSTGIWVTNTEGHADEHDSCLPEASISLLQGKLEVVKSNEMPARAIVPEKGSLVMNAFKHVADEARAKLVAGTKDGAMPNTTDPGAVFSSVLISLPLGPPVISRQVVPVADTLVLEDKNIIPSGLTPPCRVYGIGVAPSALGEHPTFENDVAQRGCDTHAFDCTVKVDDPNVKNAAFNFHPWCIGRDTLNNSDALKNTGYIKNQTNQTGFEGRLAFKSLVDTMAELNHTSLDLLKFDIEGNEWDLFNEELANGMALPVQMSFELHTEGALKDYVSPAVVKGKGFKQVNELFLKLFDLGYRVASKEINLHDRHCAEFVVVNEKAVPTL